MRKGCLGFILGSMFICLLVCIGVTVFGRPYIHRWERDRIAEQFSTVVAQQIKPVNGTIQPGAYKFTDQQLNDYLSQNLDVSSIDSAHVHITSSVIALTIKMNGGQESTYTGKPSAVGGKLVMSDMKSDNSGLNFLLPASAVGDAIEKSVNDYLAANKVTLRSAVPATGLLTLNVAGPK